MIENAREREETLRVIFCFQVCDWRRVFSTRESERESEGEEARIGEQIERLDFQRERRKRENMRGIIVLLSLLCFWFPFSQVCV